MKKIFVFGVLGLVAFEIANVWFIMPMPYSQRMRSIDIAYAIYRWRWLARPVFGAMIVAGLPAVWRAGGWRRVVAPLALALAAALTWMVNFRMAADAMFKQPTVLTMVPTAVNKVAEDRLVVGIEINGDARAYPLQFIGYHHQVRDTVGGEDVLVSYCTVCRTGRVFKPVVDGKSETFRLVGMDQFNAMLEDRSTGSWWRQANGEAIAGPSKGKAMPELPSVQVTLKQWLTLHPTSKIMQGDPVFARQYGTGYAYERGTSQSELTGTDTASWQDKSWVVGISSHDKSKAYDWNRLRRERVVNDVVGGTPIVIALGADEQSFFAFERPDAGTKFELKGDSLVANGKAYAFNGRGPAGTAPLKQITASQEFWHSWRTFKPGTDRY